MSASTSTSTSMAMGMGTKLFVLVVFWVCGQMVLVTGTPGGNGVSEFQLPMRVQMQNSAEPKVVYFGQFGNKMYYRSETRLTQSEANAYCRINGMKLLTIESRGEQDYLIAPLLDAGGTFWTSAVQKAVEREHFYWDESGVTLGFGIPGFPAYRSHAGLCIQIEAEVGGSGSAYIRYVADQCDHVAHALCQSII